MARPSRSPASASGCRASVAPALDQVCHRLGKPYPCGKVARAALWDLVGGRDVICTPVPGADGAGEAVPATCTAGGASLGEGMVERGWALADRAAGDAYGALEDAAEGRPRALAQRVRPARGAGREAGPE